MITDPPTPKSQPRVWLALIPVGALITFIIANALIHGESEWAPHIPLVLAAAVAALIGVSQGTKWKAIEEGILHGISIGMKAVLILCVIGIMIGTWIASGIVPVLIYYGLQFMNPSYFLVATCLICSVVSVATGSSWTTAGTVGIALIGVGQGLGVPLPMAAGAIISGAYLGDKMSPLSDSTNLAPAVAGSDLFDHIRHMLYTTVPAYLIALVLYAILGARGFAGESSSEAIDAILATLNQAFNITPLLLLPPLLVVAMVVFRLPALPALLGAAVLGAILAVTVQGISLKAIVDIMQAGFTAETNNDTVNELLSRGGLESMMYTVSLVLCALTFGGVMERCGFLQSIASAVLRLAKSTGSLVATTVATCFGMNILASDQYLSIIVPGRMYQNAYRDRGLHPKNLSRTLEDAGTLTSPFIAWNTCGAFMSQTLTVAPLAYLPYCFLNLLTPVIAIALAYLGWTMVKLEPEKQSESG